MTDVLAKICADKRQHIADRKAARPLSEIRAAAEARNRIDPPRGFRARLERVVRSGRFGLIAEIKRDFSFKARLVSGASCTSTSTSMPNDSAAASSSAACASLRAAMINRMQSAPRARASATW